MTSWKSDESLFQVSGFCGNLRFILLHATTWLDDCHTSYTRVCTTSRGLAFNTFKTSDGLQSLSLQIDVFLLDSISMLGMIANSIVSSKSVWACFWFQKRGLAHKPAMTYGTLSWRSASVNLDSCNDLQAGNQQVRDIKSNIEGSQVKSNCTCSRDVDIQTDRWTNFPISSEPPGIPWKFRDIKLPCLNGIIRIPPESKVTFYNES